MASLGRVGFLAMGVVFHLIYIYSIFDIYFVSPIVSGMREHSMATSAPAKRLFLVVGDGLRADKCFQSHPDPDDKPTVRHLAPYLRSKALLSGTFGVSHTRVPTESRPGHVALIAGLYEDVSSVTTGWKLNPVNFDSIFNRSRHTWSWGSPDILPMFKEGASDGARVDAYTYDEEMEDFTADATSLDIWVFDRVKAFFDDARRNATLNAMLHQDKIVFFLHLLGLDTTGHSYRPYSDEYLRNIKVVDQGVRETEKLVNDFYGNDGKSAWIFTADHGMSDWGSHGDGHPDNTRTPLVAWGAGVHAPVPAKKLKDSEKTGHEDGFSSDWDMNTVRRVDVMQADVAALMAYLLGIDWPTNSVGELPLEFVDANMATKAQAVWTNMRQILEMYRVKEEQKKSHTLRYRPFSALQNLETRFGVIKMLISSGSYEDAIAESLALTRAGLQGLRYLQTYDWLFLRALVTLGYLGWIAYAMTTVIDIHVLHGTTQPCRTTGSSSFFTSVLVVLYSILFVQRSRLTYYAYAFFPVVFWEEVWAHRLSIAKGTNELVKNVGLAAGAVGLLMQGLAAIALIEAMVIGYFRREVFSGCFLLVATLPFLYGKRFLVQNLLLVVSWLLCCVLMSTFTLLPVVKRESELQILLAGVSMFTIGLFYMALGHRVTGLSPTGRDLLTKLILGIQVGIVGLSVLVTLSSVQSLKEKRGLPLGNQIVGWIVLAMSLVIPFLHRLAPHPHYVHRLMIIFLSFAPTFVLLTIEYEGLFYVVFSATLLCWLVLEMRIYASTNGTVPSVVSNATGATSKKYRSLTIPDFRISLLFLFFLQAAFFSTGNIASISSFSLDSVYRLIPIFDPFSMGALLMFKLLVPFALISTTLSILNKSLGVEESALFMVVTAVSDVLTMNFFWLVKDEGSWLEIGTSISHFCIAGGLGVFVVGLEGLGGWMGKGAESTWAGSLDIKVNDREKD